MRLKLKEDPREWRKSAWLSALGLAAMSSLLRWRRALPATAWAVILALLAVAAVAAWIRPRLFRGFYRLSNRAGFVMVEALGRIVLGLFFLLALTPLGVAMRLLGKDPLRLKRPASASCWAASKESSPLERMF
jgi:DMSO/TMAO reductase YedYZ heme-binding membrane subunit